MAKKTCKQIVRILDSLYVTRAATVLLGCTNCDVKLYYLLYASYSTETKQKVISRTIGAYDRILGKLQMRQFVICFNQVARQTFEESITLSLLLSLNY